MTLQCKSMRLFASTVLVAALSSFASPAFALDADDFATKLAAVASQGGTKMSFAAVEPDGDTIVLKSTRFEFPGQPPFDIGDVTFNGVEEEDDGAYSVDQVMFSDINVADKGDNLSIADIEMSGLFVPADLSYDTLDTVLFYESLSTGKLQVTREGTEVFSLAGIDLEVDRADDDSTVAMAMTASGLRVDLSQIDDPKTKQLFSELGYKTLSGDLDFKGSWDVATGTIKVNEYALTLNDVGRLAMQLEVSGYTLKFIEGLQQAQAAAAANPDPKAAEQAMGFAMLGMLQQLSFNSASIRFDDASVTQRALAFAGKQQGISGEQMGQALRGMLPLMLGQLGIPALQQQISVAANAFFENPKNLTISAKPAQPVAVPVIMGAGMGDPRSLVDLLNVKVTAND